ncbi:hypothetical protein Taro_042351 [Colocasia esculenta]|uniref:Uncharacterized protein n=1 Tax=Colocasia esculenta TaxID=4460 RepID=A0A843X2F2_COLES|nr:hypothetical protein [Colocasia esculenta]
MSKPQLGFPSCNRTPKHLGSLNTLHPNPRDEFTTCWGHVEGLLVAGELWIDHKKAIFFPRSSATTYANYPLGVDQSIEDNKHTEASTLHKDFYPGSDLLSTGVLRLVPEQQLRIPLPKGTVPLKDTYTSSHSWPSLLKQKRYNTP